MERFRHISFTLLNIHKHIHIYTKKIYDETLCHHEEAIPLDRKQGKQQNNQKISESSTAESVTELSSRDYTGHNQRSGKQKLSRKKE